MVALGPAHLVWGSCSTATSPNYSELKIQENSTVLYRDNRIIWGGGSETRCLCVALDVLELALYTRLALNSKDLPASASLSAGIKGLYYQQLA